MLIQIDTQNRIAQKATSATMFGSNANKWPAKWWDVCVLLETQRNMEEAAAFKAR